MRRREFVSILGGAAAWPFAARAQQPGIPVIGFLCSGSSVTDGSRIASVQKGLKESGYVEGQNLVIEYRWAEERYDRLTALARDLAQRPVDLIAAIGTTPAAVAAKTATTVVPIVFVIGTDPVKLGLVVSLNRPAGNLTGVSFLNRVIVAKQFALLHEAVPKATVSGFLVNPTNPYADSDTSDAQAAAGALGKTLLVVKADSETDIETAFTILTRHGAGSLLVAGDLIFNNRKDQIIALAARHSMPVLYPWREGPVAGGLISYGADIADAFRQGGIYAGKVLKCAKPADLPVEQVTKLELVINLKTAKALGVKISDNLLSLADEVIE